MNDAIRALFHKIDTAPHTERATLFIGSLPVIADAYRDAGNDDRADFATWLYKVAYIEQHRVKVRCVPAALVRPFLGARKFTLVRGPAYPEGPALWNVEGLQPLVWDTLGRVARSPLGVWPKKNVSAFNLFVRLFAWAKPVLHLLTTEIDSTPES